MIAKGDYFFMCFVEGGSSPTVKHETENIALTEAKRLCDSTGKRVYVLKALKACENVKYQIDDLKSEPLPF